MAVGFAQYERAGNEVASPRQMEAQVFSLVNRLLSEAADPVARIHALHRNHKLWSLLLKDVSLSANGLPDALKQKIIALAVWSMRYSTVAIPQPLPLHPLIEVNRNMIEALTTATAASGPVAAPVLSGALTA